MFRVIPLRSGKNLVRLSLNSTIKTSVANGHAAAPAATAHHGVSQHGFDRMAHYPRIGNREIVGFGHNGQPSYFDHPNQPLPAVRWSEDTAEIKALREKAKGDWASLTIDEKKTCKIFINKRIYSILFNFINNKTYQMKYIELILEALFRKQLHQMVNGNLHSVSWLV
jgi:hypothetical protein